MEDKEIRETKKPNNSKFLFILIAVIAVVVFVLLQNKTPPNVDINSSYTKQGPIASDFSLPGLDGRMVSLSDHKGKVVLVNFWATWCPPCVAEIPSLDKLYQTLKGENFELLAVSIDEGGKKTVEKFIKRKDISFPVLLDPEGSIARLYRTRAVPESFIIRKDGTIDTKIPGAINWTAPNILEHFNKLIQE